MSQTISDMLRIVRKRDPHNLLLPNPRLWAADTKQIQNAYAGIHAIASRSGDNHGVEPDHLPPVLFSHPDLAFEQLHGLLNLLDPDDRVLMERYLFLEADYPTVNAIASSVGIREQDCFSRIAVIREDLKQNASSEQLAPFTRAARCLDYWERHAGVRTPHQRFNPRKSVALRTLQCLDNLGALEIANPGPINAAVWLRPRTRCGRHAIVRRAVHETVLYFEKATAPITPRQVATDIPAWTTALREYPALSIPAAIRAITGLRLATPDLHYHAPARIPESLILAARRAIRL